MSFSAVTGWQIVCVFALYSALVLALPAMAFRPRLKSKRTIDRFLFCLVAGNFWIITVTLLLLLLGLANAFTVLLFTYGAALLIVYARNRANVNHFLKLTGQTVWWLVRGELRGGLYLHRALSTLGKWLRGGLKCLWRWVCPRWVELALFTLCMLANLWYVSYQVVHIGNLGASDLPVHLFWLDSALEGTALVSGVYPFGYHSMLYYIKVITGVDSLVLIRVMGVVQSGYIAALLYLLARQLCRNKYSAIVALMIFTLSSAFNENALMRYQWSLPQEYAMLFLYPMALYLQQYYALTRKLRKQDSEPEEAVHSPAPTKDDAPIPPPRSRFMAALVRLVSAPRRLKTRHAMLILFGMSLSLTLSVHLYVTIAGALLCIGVTLPYLGTVLRPRCFLPLAASVLLAVLVAVTPLAAAYVTGTPLEGSLMWGVSVINDTAERESEEAQPTEDVTTMTALERGKSIVSSARYFTISSISPKWWGDLSIALLLITGMLSLTGTIFWQKNERMRWWLGIVLYIGLLYLVTRYQTLGLPSLMDGARSSIFISYALALMYAVPFELINLLLRLWRASSRACNAVLCALCVLSTGATRLPIAKNGLYPARQLSKYYSYQYPAAISLLYDLFAQYPAFSWTLVSSVHENQLVYDHGRHYDLSTFLLDVEDWREDKEMVIPTPYVFFLVEKQALEYDQTIIPGVDSIRSTPTSDALAAIALPERKDGNGLSYYKENRPVVMSKALAYLEALKKLYPHDLTLYYEDENTVCYRLKQNTLELYDLAINYGYNVPMKGGKTP